MADTSANELFTGMLREAGMPVTQDEMQQAWDAINTAQGSQITNNSAWSPFWRLISAIVTAPAQWLVSLLVQHALPNVFLRYASGTWLDIYAWGVDVTRKAATSAEGTVTFTRASAVGELVIPAATAVESPDLAGMTYRVLTTAEAVIPEGQTSLDVAVQAEKPGTAYNLGPGYYSILPKPVPGVTTVANSADWLTQAGTDEEDDEALRLRCRNQFAAVGQYHQDAAYKALIVENFPLRIDYLFFEKDGPRGPGTANCHVMVESGIPPQALIDSINDFIRDSGNHGHGDDMLCMPIAPLPVTLGVTVYPVISASQERAEALRLEVENRVRCAFRENTDYTVTKVLPYSRFSFSRLSEELHAGLPDLRSVVFDREDIVALLELPQLDVLTVSLGVEA
ncbi:Baseplate J family protein [Desulfovibrio sp. X2]|uniref:baseplate J/gp47 family protein n=1 Tax=Desulfovibrio sp. X2 TaxID=941449 RepID=UPI000358715F|nr:baseplate J/gp47 family protein [Desulfovibrio sp. X2]EPR43144.1 Baseplate J family protein [Desulfovibrio sp. X2]